MPLVNVPSVIGFFQPGGAAADARLTGLSPEQLEAVIAHELGHVKRFDVA
jgi:Zn-dependent protease with chaperone function